MFVALVFLIAALTLPPLVPLMLPLAAELFAPASFFVAAMFPVTVVVAVVVTAVLVTVVSGCRFDVAGAAELYTDADPLSLRRCCREKDCACKRCRCKDSPCLRPYACKLLGCFR